MAANNTIEKTSKKPSDEPYQEILLFTKTGKISLFESKNNKFSVSIVLTSSRMRPIIYVIDNNTGPNLVRADVLDSTWLYSVSQRDMLEIQNSSTITLSVSGTTTVHLRIAESSTRVKLGIADKLVVRVLPKTIFIDEVIR